MRDVHINRSSASELEAAIEELEERGFTVIYKTMFTREGKDFEREVNPFRKNKSRFVGSYVQQKYFAIMRRV